MQNKHNSSVTKQVVHTALSSKFSLKKSPLCGSRGPRATADNKFGEGTREGQSPSREVRRAHFSTAVFDITYSCNDTCEFCFNKAFLNRDPALTLPEIKKNYAYVKKKYDIRQVILSGGEPTLHPQFWEVMDFFYNHTTTAVSLNTNSLRLADPTLADRLLTFMRSAKNPKKYFSLSLSTVDHAPPRGAIEMMKFEGLKNALAVAYQTGTKAVVVVIVTKTNYRAIPWLVRELLAHKQSFAVHAPQLSVTLRGLFLDEYMTAAQKAATVPTQWVTLRPFIQKTLAVFLTDPTTKVRLFGLPLCYFKRWKQLPELIPQMDPWWHEVRMKVNYNHQLATIKPSEHFGEVWSKTTCDACSLNYICNKIQHEFLDEYDYPPLTPF